MKKTSLFLLLIIFNLNLYSQDKAKKSIPNSIYLNFLPSDANPADLRPSDIPSEQVLKQMGLSQEEIQEALDFKFQRGNYAPSKNISDTNSVIDFYQNLGDTLNNDSILYPKAKIFGQDVFRNNSMSFYDKALDAKAPENYKVGSGDEVSISIWGYSQFSETLIVNEQGYIVPSSYGRIYVKGLTFKKMRSLLKSKFSTFLDMKNSEIDVTLAYSRVITVNIVGEVYKPGSYTIPAINTVFNALIAAHGPTQIGSVRDIYVKRNGKTVASLDVYKFLFDPEFHDDIYLQDGDYIVVPPANSLVEIKGAINRPYTYEIKTDETVSHLIKYSGGYTPNAFSDMVTLKRINYNTIRVNDIYEKDMHTFLLKNGDEIVVNQISNQISNVITIEGSVGVSGMYEFKDGERILSLLNRAKCIDEKTFLEKVYIIRLNADRTKSHIAINLDAIINDQEHEDNIFLKEYDIVRVLSVEDFDDEFIVSVYGSVRLPGDLLFGNGMNLQDVLLQSGGLTQQAEGSRIEISRIMDYDIGSNKLKPKRAIIKSVKIGSNLILSDIAKNFLLQPFDQIFVRSNPDFEAAKNINLLGEVRYPGVYTLLRKDETIASVIKRAGGLTSYAYLDGAKMFREFKIENVNIDSQVDNSSEDIPINIFESKEDVFSYDVVYLDLKKALKSFDSKHNLVLNNNDSIIIPKTLDLVHIQGALKNYDGNSISAPYFGRKRANYYVKNFAGGFTKENSRANTLVVYPNGVTKKAINFGLFSVSPKVKKGATIKVVDKIRKEEKEKEPKVDWNAQIENAMLKVTAVLTLWLLIDKVNAE